MERESPVLEVRDLRTWFETDDGVLRVVDGVSFRVAAGRTLCIVGESGCGKSDTALSVMGLLPSPPARVAGGEVLFEGRDLLKLDRRALRALQGDRLAMIFQEPMTSLNPVFTVGDQLTEAILCHRARLGRREAEARAVAMLRRVRIPAPERRMGEYPHQLSGGMRQRVMIAMALANDPRLLIADEPTTALDVTIQAQILDLMRELREATGAAVVLITHDLGVVGEVADEVIVMYAGKVVEQAPVEALLSDPQHPYTLGLLASVPRLDGEPERLTAIQGAVPPPDRFPAGCRFAPRCPFAVARCREAEPPLAELAPGHRAACWRAPLERTVAAAGGGAA
ncbi:MAG TPA: ABC transporter ATP-binding protein [Geminicoccaceae bacterium]|nr:ABC transporter ATP-binding protein [Geminicoccaceae bacterium]